MNPSITPGEILLHEYLLPMGISQNAMARARTVARVTGNPPIKIVQYDNGRLVAEDPATGASIELYAFGSDNKAAVERLLRQQ